MKRLLTIGHSYVVAANRQLAHYLALEGHGQWDVTAVAPVRYRGDLRRISVEPIAGEACTLHTVPVRIDRVPHVMSYGGNLREILAADWDAVHCWEEPYTRSAAQVAKAVAPRTKLLFASFQNISKTYPWPLRAYEREAMTRANGWIAFGETVRAALGHRPGYADRPVRVIPPGVDLERFRPDAEVGRAMRARLGWPVDAFVVGYLGRFVKQKGIETVTDVVVGCHPEWRALFVGGGDLESSLRSFARRHAGRVHVQTGIAHGDVPAWLNTMSVLCAPSRTTRRWREQFGRMLIEAMACGVPVIASDSGEMPYVIGDAGTIAAEADDSAWRRAIEQLAVDEGARQTSAARGLARVHERYAWPLVARRHLAFFDEVLAA
jgi:glycosyltransferase involved in cell wall biosynthesis